MSRRRRVRAVLRRAARTERQHLTMRVRESTQAREHVWHAALDVAVEEDFAARGDAVAADVQCNTIVRAAYADQLRVGRGERHDHPREDRNRR